MDLSTVGMDSKGKLNEVIRRVWILGMDLSGGGMDFNKTAYNSARGYGLRPGFSNSEDLAPRTQPYI